MVAICCSSGRERVQGMGDSGSSGACHHLLQAQDWVEARRPLSISRRPEPSPPSGLAPSTCAHSSCQFFLDGASSPLGMSHFWAVLLGPPQCGPDTPWHDSKLLFTPIQDARRFWPAPGLGAFLPFQLASSQLSELWSAELARQPGRATCGEPASGLRRTLENVRCSLDSHRSSHVNIRVGCLSWGTKLELPGFWLSL